MEEVLRLRAEVAKLGSQLDLLQAEREHLNELLIECGFPNGITTLIGTVKEVLEEGGVDAFGEGNFASPDN
jgi:hypothetical protein